MSSNLSTLLNGGLPEDETGVLGWLSEVSSRIQVDIDPDTENSSALFSGKPAPIRKRAQMSVFRPAPKYDALQDAKKAISEYRTGTFDIASTSKRRPLHEMNPSRWEQLKVAASKRSERLNLFGQEDKVRWGPDLQDRQG